MAYSILFLVPFVLPLGWACYVLVSLLVNYNAARKTGLPIVILPFDGGHPLWMIIDRKVVSLIRGIPYCSETSFVRFNWRGWEIWDRFRAHEELGNGIFFVTPGKNYLQLCDAEAVSDIFQRRLDFPRPPEAVEMLNIFGPNLGTTDGQQWQRHRKITASGFNEHLNTRVWQESVQQATGMVRYWSSRSSINTVAHDTRTVSLHVMSGAIFGKSYPFRGYEETPSTLEEEDSSSYGQALRIILDRCIPLLVLGQQNLNKTWLPRSFRELYQATLVFQKHMTEAYEDEKRAISQGEKQEQNLMTSLVRASQASEQKEASVGLHLTGLTEKEIYGNIFVFNFAGHDATANSLALGICLLATRPDVQEWLAKELNEVLGAVSAEDSQYEAVFPRLKRCLAVTFEVVRLFTAVAIAKSTGGSPQPLKIGKQTVIIPAGTVILPNYSALHTHPRYWGADSLDFQPSRWIKSTTDPTLGLVEEFEEPPKANSPFVGWSGGARNCPGRKFSQVEFVGVLAGLFRDFKVEPVPLPGEDGAMARARLLRQIERDTGMRLLLQMLHPEKAVLRWTRKAATKST